MENEWAFKFEYNAEPESFEVRCAVQRWNRYRRDHPRACGGKLTPVPEEPFDLLGLPPEVRRLVFRFLFRDQLTQSDGILVHMSDDNSAGVDRDDFSKEPFDVRVFVVSKSIKQEAMEVFFVDNIFRIHVYGVYDAPRCRSAGCKNTRPLSVFLRPGIVPWPMDKLRRFDIVIFIDPSDFYGRYVRYICSVARRYAFSKQFYLVLFIVLAKLCKPSQEFPA